MTTLAVPLRRGEDAATIDLALETLYRFLAALLGEPGQQAWNAVAQDRHGQAVARLAADVLREHFRQEPVELGFGELPLDDLDTRTVQAELARPVDALREEHARVFGLVFNRECPPYETEYQKTEDTFFRAQQMADISGFYRAFGVQPGSDRGERPDHIATELEFVALLLGKQRLALTRNATSQAEGLAEVCAQARRDFLHEHLSWWAPAFCQAVRRRAGQGLYFAVAGLLAALLPVDRATLGVPAPEAGVQPWVSELSEDPEGCGNDEPVLHKIDLGPASAGAPGRAN